MIMIFQSKNRDHNEQNRSEKTTMLYRKTEQLGRMVAEGLSGIKSWIPQRSVKKLVLLGGSGIAVIMICTSLTVANNYITVYDGTEAYSRYTQYAQLEDILSECEIDLGEHDDYAFSGFEQDNQASLTIKRAFPVSIIADGETKSQMMTAGTVAQALQDAGVDYTDDDIITPDPGQSLEAQTNIEVYRVSYQELVEKETIDFKTEKPTEKLAENMRERIVQKGKKGERTITKQVKYIDGVEAETVILDTTVTKKPVNQVVQYVLKSVPGVSTLKYTEDDLQLDANGVPINYKYKVTGKATAYSALGRPTKLVPGCVAMDLRKFPRGTKLYIRTPNGGYVYGYSKVADTGGFVHNGSGVLVDLFFNTYQESVQFGAKTVDVYVLD